MHSHNDYSVILDSILELFGTPEGIGPTQKEFSSESSCSDNYGIQEEKR